MSFNNFIRALRTVRRLKLSQIAWRLRYRWERRRPARPIGVPEVVPQRTDFPAVPVVSHSPDARGEELLQQLQQGVFEHLHFSRRLGYQPTDWRLGPATEHRLWTVALHYHAWAWELAQMAARQGPDAKRADELLRGYLADWISRCDLAAPGSRDLAWNAYAIATRIGSWCRLYHELGPEGRQRWGPFEDTFTRSLWAQAAYLHGHLEYDLRANHLLRDAVGLAWAGRFFDGPEPRQWLQTATRLAVEQADEQVLGDGGHFERSPMYHLHVMEDLLVLAFLLEDEPARQKMRNTWRQMAEFLAWVRHPDGQIPLLNDGGFNGACDPKTMLATGGTTLGTAVDPSPRSGGKLFPDFGLVVWHGNPWSVFFDVGPVGPDYQPGHAHADSLTFEASYAGERLFVDPGSLAYDDDETRQYDRSTASHNTVCVDQADSSEVWHIFRVGRRARPVDVQVRFDDKGFEATAAHTGYDHLPGRPRHGRTLRALEDGSIEFVDCLEGSGCHTIESGLLLAAAWQVEETSQGWTLRHGEHLLLVTLEGPELQRSTCSRPYHPQYGRTIPCQRLCWRATVELPQRLIVRVRPGAC